MAKYWLEPNAQLSEDENQLSENSVKCVSCYLPSLEVTTAAAAAMFLLGTNWFWDAGCSIRDLYMAKEKRL